MVFGESAFTDDLLVIFPQSQEANKSSISVHSASDLQIGLSVLSVSQTTARAAHSRARSRVSDDVLCLSERFRPL